ncbi:MAG: helix-turn-helix domain-containing protein [Leptospiraceae bacterium]|nr:helix-turn-helix domain-containing protein [Leptospiraceae bacterium]MCP5496732.1 helix-turn-helix domain-containing protein [Leptospiraceae bacterium]
MSENFQYFKFMTDIIDSGTWAKLSSAAKSLYPVLLKFSDQTFKYVWPSTETLMRLTGFKTKKSVILAKKELMNVGLIRTVSGSGRTNSRYYFSFNYEGSKITPLGDKEIYRSGVLKSTAEACPATSLGDSSANPNNINITITNNPGQKAKNSSNKTKNTDNYFKNNFSEDVLSYESLLDIYGIEILNYAYSIAQKRNLENDISHIKDICKARVKEISSTLVGAKQTPNNNLEISSIWSNFIRWTEIHLTSTSIEMIKNANILIEGRTIIVQGELNKYLQQVIVKYFSEKVTPKIFISFSNNEKINGKALNGIEFSKNGHFD